MFFLGESASESKVSSDGGLVFEMKSEDGFSASSRDINDLWRRVFEAVQDARVKHDMAPLARNPSQLGQFGLQMMGLTHSALAFLLEQLPGAQELEKYEFKHEQFEAKAEKKEVLVENPTGSARTESYKTRNPLDMVSIFSSKIFK